MATFNNTDLAAFKGVWVFCEQRQGKLMPTDYELISEGRKLADELGVELCGLLLGDNVEGIAKELGGYGADKVIVCDSPLLKEYTTDAYAKVICDVITEMKPEVFLIGATNIGRDLGPRCAARLHTGLCADCTHLDVDVEKYVQFLSESSTLDLSAQKFNYEDRNLKMTRPAFGGNIMAQIVTENNRPQFATVRYKVFNAPELVKNPTGAVEKMAIQPEKLVSSIKVLEIIKKEKGLDISEAETIVAVGRGVKSEKDLEIISAFAEKIGATVACTRPGIEAGWFDPRLQIGLSGRTVKPKLIIALGISGAVQFTAGMQNSEYIIAVNNDPEAPIFNVAHCGIVGDLYEVLPELLELIEAQEGMAI